MPSKPSTATALGAEAGWRCRASAAATLGARTGSIPCRTLHVSGIVWHPGATGAGRGTKRSGQIPKSNPGASTSCSVVLSASVGADPAQPLFGVACAELLGAFVPAPRLLGVGLDAAHAELCELGRVERASQRHRALG